MTLLDSTLLYHSSVSLYMTIEISTMTLLHTTWLYISLPWIYLTLYLTLYYSTMARLHSTSLCITMPWLYFTLLDPTLLYHGSTPFYWLYKFLSWLYFMLLDSTLDYHGSIWLYIALPWPYFTPLYSTLHYNDSTFLYFLYFGVCYSTMALLSLYLTLYISQP